MNRTGLRYRTPADVRAIPNEQWEEWLRGETLPEHYVDGIRGMSLLDLVEMLCDWKAATERTANGDLAKSIEFNKGRFGYSDELAAILTNTAREMAMIPADDSRGE